MTEKQICEDILKIIKETFPGTDNIQDGDNWLGTGAGRIQSMQILRIIFLLEKKFGVRFDASELTEEKFRTPRMAAALIFKKLGQR